MIVTNYETDNSHMARCADVHYIHTLNHCLVNGSWTTGCWWRWYSISTFNFIDCLEEVTNIKIILCTYVHESINQLAIICMHIPSLSTYSLKKVMP